MTVMERAQGMPGQRSVMNRAPPPDQSAQGPQDLVCPQCQLGQLNSCHCKRICELGGYIASCEHVFPLGAGWVRFRRTARETWWTFGSRLGTGDFGRHRLKRSQQVRHRRSEVATHTVTHAPHFFTALRQYTTSFTLAAQFDEYLPQQVVGR